MAVKIKLLRMGKIRAPRYRIVVADARTKRDGRFIEAIGTYQPTEEPSLIQVDSARAQHWLSVGAQPTEPVQAILKVTGDWQRFRGEPGAEGTLRVAEPRPDKRVAFEAAAREAAGEAKAPTTTAPRKERSQQAGETGLARAAATDPGPEAETGTPDAPAENVAAQRSEVSSNATGDAAAAGAAVATTLAPDAGPGTGGEAEDADADAEAAAGDADAEVVAGSSSEA